MSSDSARPFDGTRAGDVMEKDFYDTIEETVQQSGTTFPTWDRSDPQRIGLTTCTIGSQLGNYLTITLRGGSIDDPKSAADKIKAYWESHGWKIETVFDHSDAPKPWSADLGNLSHRNRSNIRCQQKRRRTRRQNRMVNASSEERLLT